MASFNLGKIKGDKGEKGDIGPKGEKGEKGDRGESGADGFTPVFSIAQTRTLENDADAFVELDSSDVKNPVLTFNIPKGKDGLDSSGDMQSDLYDKNQRKTDIYEYAEKLAEDSFKKTGGTFNGQVKAYASEPDDMCVRNFSVAGALPGDAKNGDICVLVGEKSNITLKDIEPGSIVLVKESGQPREYIVFSNDATYSGVTTLLRKNLLNEAILFNNQATNVYQSCNIDFFLNTLFFNCIDEKVRNKLVQVQVESGVCRSIFLASKDEISSFGHFERNSPAAQADDGTIRDYWTRTAAGGTKFYCFDGSGRVISNFSTVGAYLRPVIALPCDTYVENTNTSSGVGFKMTEKKGGIYIMKNGEWSECEL